VEQGKRILSKIIWNMGRPEDRSEVSKIFPTIELQVWEPDKE
jgi:hypothetical protein